jgi:anti-sigma B factor antagonist
MPRTYEDHGFSITSEARAGRRFVSLSGELDLARIPELHETLLEAEATDAREICLDLSGLRFLDVAGLVEILKAQARSRRDSNRLTLTCCSREIHRLLRLTGVDAELRVVEADA